MKGKLAVVISGLVVVAAAAVGTTTTVAASCLSSNTPTPPPMMVGLQNMGSTCYLNAQLQCAYHIPLIRHLILSTATTLPHSPPIPITTTTTTAGITRENKEGDESTALLALRRVFRDMSNNSNTNKHEPVSPRVLCQAVNIPVFEQQDSQEFWKLLLPTLQLPALTDLYTGAYQDYIQALDGSGRERRREETFLDLSLDIVSDGTLEAALQRQFGEPELLSLAAGNAWRPAPGADKVDAHKGSLILLQGLPSVLQLHLKRFQFDWQTETTTKINDAFEFSERLDLRTIVPDSQNKDDRSGDGDATAAAFSSHDCCYELQAVIVHVGKFDVGHYYAYVRPNLRSSSGRDDWYRFNDEVVTKVSFADVVQDAYGGRQPRVKANTNIMNDQGYDKMKGGDSKMTRQTKGNLFTRMLWSFFGQGSDDNGGDDDYGYGGPTSNAYVLQYVRRCDIPRLYDIAPGD